MPGGFICIGARPPHSSVIWAFSRESDILAKIGNSRENLIANSRENQFPIQFQNEIGIEGDYAPFESAHLSVFSADLSSNTVAILAQGTSWAVAVTQAFCYRCKYFLAPVVHLHPMYASSGSKMGQTGRPHTAQRRQVYLVPA